MVARALAVEDLTRERFGFSAREERPIQRLQVLQATELAEHFLDASEHGGIPRFGRQREPGDQNFWILRGREVERGIERAARLDGDRARCRLEEQLPLRRAEAPRLVGGG